MTTYTAYKLNLNGGLSHRENLNGLDDLNAWLANVYGKFATVLIIQDQTGAARICTDDGEWWSTARAQNVAGEWTTIQA